MRETVSSCILVVGVQMEVSCTPSFNLDTYPDQTSSAGSMSFSQVFTFTETSHIPQEGLKLQSYQLPLKCLVAEATKLDVDDCKEGDSAQTFTIEGNHTAVWKPNTDTESPHGPQKIDDTGSGNATASTDETESLDEDDLGVDSGKTDSPTPVPTPTQRPFENSASRFPSFYETIVGPKSRIIPLSGTPLGMLLQMAIIMEVVGIILGYWPFGPWQPRWVYWYLILISACVLYRCITFFIVVTTIFLVDLVVPYQKDPVDVVEADGVDLKV